MLWWRNFAFNSNSKKATVKASSSFLICVLCRLSFRKKPNRCLTVTKLPSLGCSYAHWLKQQHQEEGWKYVLRGFSDTAQDFALLHWGGLCPWEPTTSSSWAVPVSDGVTGSFSTGIHGLVTWSIHQADCVIWGVGQSPMGMVSDTGKLWCSAVSKNHRII